MASCVARCGTRGAPFRTRARGAHGGGCFAGANSVVNLLAKGTREERRIIADPYALVPRDTPAGSDTGPQMWVRRDGNGVGWTAPFAMAAINEKAVRRSAALLQYAPSLRRFSYSEAVRRGASRAGGRASGRARGRVGWGAAAVR
jgi:short subunit dehydrogenase-like uncharacterized protein